MTATKPEPLFKADLAEIPAYKLAELTFTYRADPETLQLLVDELEQRGIDPFD